MKITFSDKENYQKKYTAIITGHNIIVDEGNYLSGSTDKYLNYDWQYSADYKHVSNGLVNTRFTYPYNGSYKTLGLEGKSEVFANLDRFQRMRLIFMTKRSWFHLHPVATWALILNSFFAFCNVFSAYQNHQRSTENIQTSYIGAITKHVELQKLQADQYQKQIDYLLHLLADNKSDTMPRPKDKQND